MDMMSELPSLTPPFWCNVCSLDLQSEASLREHEQGRKHLHRQGRPHFKSSALLLPPPMNEDEFLQALGKGCFQNTVVLTGAGISTNAGISDFRSSGGLFDQIGSEFGDRFPVAKVNPEHLFSREFSLKHPDVWRNEILPLKLEKFNNARATMAHQFCAHLHRMGWLRRIYTQNIDGLHRHESLHTVIPEEMVVECHGNLLDGNLVMYGDKLPARFFEIAAKDFDASNNTTSTPQIDLVLVIGTALQVAPFCALPNMAPKYSTRVVINRSIQDLVRNDFSSTPTEYRTCLSASFTTSIGERKNVPLRPLWGDRKASKKWRQMMFQADCDDFFQRYCEMHKLDPFWMASDEAHL